MRDGRSLHRARLLVILTVLLLFVCAEGGEAAGLTPDPPPGGSPYRSAPIFDMVDPSAYTLDANTHFSDPATKGIELSMNQVLVLKAWFVRLVIRLMEYAFVLDPFEALFQRADLVGQNLFERFWLTDGGPLLAGALAVAGLWGLIASLRHQVSRGMRVLGGTALVLLLSLLLLTEGRTTLRFLQESARMASVQTLGSMASIAGSPHGGDLIEKGGTAAWRALVYDPWVAYEFTDLTAAKRYGTEEFPGNRLLAWSSSRRKNEYRVAYGDDASRAAVFGPWSEDGLIGRAAMAWATLSLALAYGIPMILLAGSVLLYQLVLCLSVGFLPLSLLLALWMPGRGLTFLRRTCGLLLSALVLQVVLTAALSLVLLLQVGLGSGLVLNGWQGQAILLALVALAGLRYRFGLLDLVGAGWSPLRQGQEMKEPRTVRVTAVQPSPVVQAEQDAPSTTRGVVDFRTLAGRMTVVEGGSSRGAAEAVSVATPVISAARERLRVEVMRAVAVGSAAPPLAGQARNRNDEPLPSQMPGASPRPAVERITPDIPRQRPRP